MFEIECFFLLRGDFLNSGLVFLCLRSIFGIEGQLFFVEGGFLKFMVTFLLRVDFLD